MSSKETTKAERHWFTERGADYADSGFGPRLSDRQYFFRSHDEPGITAEEMCDVANALERDLAAAQARVAELEGALNPEGRTR